MEKNRFLVCALLRLQTSQTPDLECIRLRKRGADLAIPPHSLGRRSPRWIEEHAASKCRPDARQRQSGTSACAPSFQCIANALFDAHQPSEIDAPSAGQSRTGHLRAQMTYESMSRDDTGEEQGRWMHIAIEIQVLHTVELGFGSYRTS